MRDAKNELIDLILKTKNECNQNDYGDISPYVMEKIVLNTWSEIVTLAELADQQRQEWAGK